MSDFEKEKQSFELYLKEVQSTVKEDAFCTWADKSDKSFIPSFWDLAQAFYGGYHSRDEENAHLRAEIERKNEAITKAKLEIEKQRTWNGQEWKQNHIADATANKIHKFLEQALSETENDNT